MSSQIEGIIDAIKAWTPQYDTDTSINTMDIDEMPVDLDETDCPVRVFSCVDPKNNSEFAHIALGPAGGVEWNILDRLYITPTVMEMGFAGNNARIIQYVASYFDQARQNRGISTSISAHVRNVSVTPPYVRNWPDYEGGKQFYVVDCVVHVQEIIT